VAVGVTCPGSSQVRYVPDTPLALGEPLPGTGASVRKPRAARRGHLVVVDEVGRGEDEHFAHHVGLLLVAAHESDHALPGRILDHGLKALAHDFLEPHPLIDHGRAATTIEQRLLNAREPAAQNTHHQIVLKVRLSAGRTATVELL